MSNNKTNDAAMNRNGQTLPGIPTPEEVFGFRPGAENCFAGWADQTAYYRRLSTLSDRMIFDEMAKTPEGNPFYALIISAPENLAKLDRYKEISRRLAACRDYDEAEAASLAKEGKAFVLISMSLHSHEIGGGQTSPELVYHLLSDDGEETRNILKNVILILFPCANPDGMNVEERWYAKYKDTYYTEITFCPLVYQKFAGHGNNRDFVFENLIETRCINDYLLRRCHTNINIDFHHVPWDWNRMVLSAPGANPVREELSPLLLRELAACGTGICCALEEADIPDVAYGHPEYTYDQHFALSTMPRYHNIVSILSESAHLEKGLRGEYFKALQCGSKDGIATVSNPHPWEGGMWTLADIVRQIFVAAVGCLSYAARNKEQVLKNASLMAARQTRRGAETPEQGYLIPAAQHDASALHRLLGIFDAHGIEYAAISDDVVTEEGVPCPAGSIYVPLAQPDYAMVSLFLKKRKEPNNRYTRYSDGAYEKNSDAAGNIAEWMGIAAFSLGKALPVKTVPYTNVYEAPKALPAQVSRNDSYKLVNRLLRDGKRVFLGDDGQTFTQKCSKTELKMQRIGLVFPPYVVAVDDPSYANLFLTTYGFDFRLINGFDIRNGVLDELDIVILPGINSEKLDSEDFEKKTVTPEAQFAFGRFGAEQLKRFVARGGRLIAWLASCDYVIDLLKLPVQNVVAGLSRAQYQVSDSTLRIRCAQDRLTLGIPEKTVIVQQNGACFRLLSGDRRNDREIAAYETENLLSSGLLNGEHLIAGKSAAVRMHCGAGEVMLYGFSPAYRCSAEGQFKFLLNALYRFETTDECV